ncbi:MAG: VOC family protein [Saccharopolyspora sp.]|uniref:VOC family protein n=1 Tax=Saccharopolyspora TaxID=1835 RepID=UPI0019098405|nr:MULTISPECIES: VOC family protein [unclassified Saccharopolyspora]MBK0867010.1 VOC family protein [Saccharopolyspora sp. HNM0986]MBQ6639585.1 VOC family protein [Saccharopolyspora sp.]
MSVVQPGSAAPRWELLAGMPCWIELATTDVDQACEFYAGLFGWDYTVHDEGQRGEHIIASREGFPVASIRRSAADHSVWRLFLAVQDVHASTEEAERHGAELAVPITHVPGIGSKAVLLGPADAEFGLLTPAESWQFDVGLPGTLMWAELVTIKAQAADTFFQSMFGYTAEQFGAENRSNYSVWYLADESVLARVSMIRDYLTPSTRPHWLVYLGADAEEGVDELVHRAVGLGGRIRVDPYGSSIGRVAVLRDPTGARFAVVDGTQATDWFDSAANFDPYDD